MKRLTVPHSERIDDTPLEACKGCIRGLGVDYPPCCECKHMKKALVKLTSYEDAEAKAAQEAGPVCTRNIDTCADCTDRENCPNTQIDTLKGA